MALEEIIAAIPSMPDAHRLHHYSPSTAGDLAMDLLLKHPHSRGTTIDEAKNLVSILAAGDTGVQTPYMLEGRPAGIIGHPGTWISTGQGKAPMFHLSPNVPGIHPRDDMPVDPTVKDRITSEIVARIQAMGVDASGFDVVRIERAAFAGDDVVVFRTQATEKGEDSFSGFFSHLAPPYSPGVNKSLDHGARTVLAHIAHGDEIRRRIDRLRTKVEKRFQPLGSRIGDTVLISVESDASGLKHVHVATDITILDDAFNHMRVFLHMSDPHKTGNGEFDGYRIHYRDLRRRLRLLAGRSPMDAYSICPIVARSYAMLSPDEAMRKAEEIREAIRNAASGQDGNGARISFKDGTLLDTVYLSEGVTYRNRSLMANGHRLPETVLTALVGRPMQDVHPDARLDGLVIKAAKIDGKGRLVVTSHPMDPIPLRPLLDQMAPA